VFFYNYFLAVRTSKLSVSSTIFHVDFRLIHILFLHSRRLCGSSLHLGHSNRYLSLGPCHAFGVFFYNYFLAVRTSKLSVSSTIFHVHFRLIHILFLDSRRLCGSSLHRATPIGIFLFAYKPKACACRFSIPLHCSSESPFSAPVSYRNRCSHSCQ
jgi:hypothetical protein